MKKTIIAYSSAAMLLLAMGCQKMERNKLGNYAQDANAANGPLKFYAAFDGTSSDPLKNAVDSMRANFPVQNFFTSTTGISGKAIEGSASNDKALKYTSFNGWEKSTSFSVAFWIKHTPQPGGAQFIFSMPRKVRTDSWTTNTEMFVLIEDNGQSTPTQAAVKVGLKEQWFEFIGANRIPNLLNGNWHHFVITYDETTSKLGYYMDGTAMTGLAANLTNVLNNGNPRGPINFTDVTGYVIGGWNQHVGLPGPGDNPAPGGEAWAKAFSGSLDQFRLYSKVLSASEVMALYTSRL